MALQIDPHVHSILSDGTDTPEELLEKARDAGLDVIGAVDHDTFEHWEAFRLAHQALAKQGKNPPAVILGSEISTSVNGQSIHLLDYLPDPEGGNVWKILRNAQRDRLLRVQRMTEKLSVDYPITWEDVAAEVKGITPGRPHLGDALVKKGYFASRQEAFEKVLHPRSPYYVGRPSVDAFAVVRAVVADGGVPFLAHPFSPTRGKHLLEADTVRKLAEEGLKGLEVNHREMDSSARALASDLANELGLLPSGGSDYHGKGKPNRLGEFLMPPASFEKLLELGHAPSLL